MPRHEFRQILAYAPERLFDLAADVESYPQFLPWWIAVRVRKREGNIYYTDQVVGFGMLRERFASKTVLRPPERIDVTSSEKPFRDFHLTWRFDPRPDNTCQVTLAVDLELRSGLLQKLFARAIMKQVGSILSAFEARAHKLYGPAASRPIR